MILSDVEIKEAIEKGELDISPLQEQQIQPSSVDLRLGEDIVIYPSYKIQILDVRDESYIEHLKEIKIPEEGILIPAKGFLLGRTREYIKLGNKITAFVEGRSSLGRLGLFIQNAGWVDAGFEGTITLEFFNANDVPIRIYPGMRICQLVFAWMGKECQNPYRGKYQGQIKTTASKIFMDGDI